MKHEPFHHRVAGWLWNYILVWPFYLLYLAGPWWPAVLLLEALAVGVLFAILL